MCLVPITPRKESLTFVHRSCCEDQSDKGADLITFAPRCGPIALRTHSSRRAMSSVIVDVPQIAWHAREPIQSVDVSPSTSLIATAGNDNEVRLWRLPRSKVVDGNAPVVFIQSLAGHSKVSES